MECHNATQLKERNQLADQEPPFLQVGLKRLHKLLQFSGDLVLNNCGTSWLPETVLQLLLPCGHLSFKEKKFLRSSINASAIRKRLAHVEKIVLSSVEGLHLLAR